MSDLINKTLEVMESNETSNIFTEAASKPSLGKLAADHAEAHQATEEDGDADKRPAIEHKIMKHYGRGTTEAVKDHSGRVNDVENKSGPGGPSYINFHGKFVKNHLGGHGSNEHKEYQKQMAHHGHADAPHQTEKDWNEHASNKINEEAQDETHSMLKDIAKKHRGMKHFYDAEKKVHVLHGHAKGDEITNYIEVKHAGEGTHHYYHSSDGNYEVHKKNLGKEDLHKQISKAWKRGDVDDSTSGGKE